MNLRFSADQREQVAQEGISLTRSVNLEQDARQLHVVLRNVATGATGSLRIRLR